MRNYDTEKEMNSRKEFDLVRSIPEHPLIIKMNEFITTENWTYTIMELADGQELQDFVFQNQNDITLKVIKHIMRQLLETIVHLHSQKICHKDIKPENVIISFKNGEAHIKLIDFNVS